MRTLTKEIVNERRLAYMDLPGPSNLGESLNVLMACWKLRGPQGGDHMFKAIHCAEVTERCIVLNTVIRHYKDGDHVDEFLWGHSIPDAYSSSAIWKKTGKGRWSTDLIASGVFRYELPCCGGRFIKTKETPGYCCIVHGHCGFCNQKWECADGHHWYEVK